MASFVNCVSLAYYVFMFERVKDTLFESKQGLKLNILLPPSVKYFVAMNVELQESYACRNIATITEKQWDIVPCK